MSSLFVLKVFARGGVSLVVECLWKPLKLDGDRSSKVLSHLANMSSNRLSSCDLNWLESGLKITPSQWSMASL